MLGEMGRGISVGRDTEWGEVQEELEMVGELVLVGLAEVDVLDCNTVE